MIVPYLLRLLCLCLASFFVVNAVLGLATAICSRRLLCVAEKMPPRSAARFLLLLRLLPVTLGLAAVLALCVPSYLLLEPDASPEHVGTACLIIASLAACLWLTSLMRAARAVSASLRCNKSWEQAGAERSGELIVESDAPLLVLSGLFHMRLVISRGVRQALSADQLDMALRHENAHRCSRDNWKRLLLLLAPAPLPFISFFSPLEQAWAKFREWAADDEAVQGDSNRALTLASALLRVAHMGTRPELSFLHTSLLAGDHDLSERIERLLRFDAPIPEPRASRHFYVSIAAILAAVSLAAFALWPAALYSVHRLLEQFLR